MSNNTWRDTQVYCYYFFIIVTSHSTFSVFFYFLAFIREWSPVRIPPGIPMFTFHIYAVLNKKFRFNQEYDTLLLCHQGGTHALEMTHFVWVWILFSLLVMLDWWEYFTAYRLHKPHSTHMVIIIIVCKSVFNLFFRGLCQQGYLIEASLSVPESSIPRGQMLTYQYQVQQRQKEIVEIATRNIQIPNDSQVKGKRKTFKIYF